MLGWKPKSYDPNVASVRFRCLIPMAELRAQKFPVELYDPGNEFEYSAVIFSKCYEPADQALATRLRSRGIPVVLDLCDNHFYNPEGLPGYQAARQNLLKMVELADLVTCSTPTLAEIVAVNARLDRLPEVVGDPVECSIELADRSITEYESRLANRTVRELMWFGIHGSPNAPCGMTDILRIAPNLNEIAKVVPFKLTICSNNRELYERHIPQLGFPTKYEQYSRDTFFNLLNGMDGVLLPISNNPFTQAKSHNRLTTSLFAGVPVVADGVPSYRDFSDFCVLDDWQRGLHELLSEPGTARIRALEGKKYIGSKWLPVHIAERWRNVLQPLLNRSRKVPEALKQ